MMRETHWNILNNLLLIQNLVTYSAFFKKRWLCYPKYHSNCIWWCCKPQLWYCCCCRSCRRPISTFQITCYLFKKPVTYSLLIQKINSNCIRWYCQQQMGCCCCCRCWGRPIRTFKMTCCLFKNPVTYSAVFIKRNLFYPKHYLNCIYWCWKS